MFQDLSWQGPSSVWTSFCIGILFSFTLICFYLISTFCEKQRQTSPSSRMVSPLPNFLVGDTAQYSGVGDFSSSVLVCIDSIAPGKEEGSFVYTIVLPDGNMKDGIGEDLLRRPNLLSADLTDKSRPGPANAPFPAPAFNQFPDQKYQGSPKDIILSFYAQNGPFVAIDDLLGFHKGNEVSLLCRIAKKYNIEVSQFGISSRDVLLAILQHVDPPKVSHLDLFISRIKERGLTSEQVVRELVREYPGFRPEEFGLPMPEPEKSATPSVPIPSVEQSVGNQSASVSSSFSESFGVAGPGGFKGAQGLFGQGGVVPCGIISGLLKMVSESVKPYMGWFSRLLRSIHLRAIQCEGESNEQGPL